MQSRDASIIAQVAGKLALKAIQTTEGYDLSSFPVLTQSFGEAIAETAETLTTVPDTAVTVAPFPQNNGAPQGYQQAVQNMAQAGLQVAPAQPANEDELWKYFVQNRDEFWDNRSDGDTSISGGTKPDFKAKSLKDQNGKPKGLWLVSRRFNKQAPDYVFQALGLQPPAQQAQQVPAAVGVPTIQPLAPPF